MSRLRTIAKDLWVIDHPLQVGGLQLGARTTVVRLAAGGVWLHSPGPLSSELVDELASVGPVQALVAPNAMHHFSLAQNVRTFPQAILYVSPALPAKLKEPFVYETLSDDPPMLWRDEFFQHVTRGIPKLKEVIFLHRASRTLILTDLAFHIRYSTSWFTRLFMRLNGVYGHFGPSRIFRMLVKDRTALRSSLNLMKDWDFDRVIVSHGEVLESGGKQVVQTQYAWV